MLEEQKPEQEETKVYYCSYIKEDGTVCGVRLSTYNRPSDPKHPLCFLHARLVWEKNFKDLVAKEEKGYRDE